MATDPKVIFVTGVAVSGFLNGVCNIAFETAQFLPREVDGETKVVVAPEITANLRFDLLVAQQVRDRLDAIIAANTKLKVMDS